METSARATNRLRLRDALIDAARALTVAHGWESVRMADVAAAAGVSRQTLYNEFDGKPGLAEALAVREIEVFVTAVRAALFAHGGDVRAAGRAAILHTLSEAERNPLVRAILTSARGGADGLFPYLTTRAQVLLGLAGDAVREWAAACLPGLDEAAVAVAAESVIRLTVSHLILPTAPPAETADVLAGVLIKLLPVT